MMEILQGAVDKVLFSSEEGYAVIRILPLEEQEPVVAVGALSAVQPGEEVKIQGQWASHPKFGKQFKAESFETSLPSEAAAICTYLASSNIEGIGPVFARRIVDTFAEKTLEILDENIYKLLKVPGIGKKRIEKIEAHWQEHQTIRSLMLFLTKHGIRPSIAWKIFKTYGELAQEKVEENPYLLARDVFGVGFKLADGIAEKLGIEKDADRRIQAGIEYVLWQETMAGHTCFPKEELTQKTEQLLEVDYQKVEANLTHLLEIESCLEEEGMIFPTQLFHIEEQIASALHVLLNNKTLLRSFDMDKAINWLKDQLPYTLADKQVEAIRLSLEEKVLVITGGPGTGKSTIINAILMLFEKLTRRILLAAPTGKAAKRMSEITRKKAFTIHSILEYDFATKGFKKGKNNHLSCDLIIVDEASMIDTYLMRSLVHAIPPTAVVIFVGDVDQLPSVGPGSVLKDLIDSKTLPTAQLTTIFRQAKQSRIVLSAHNVNQGEFPIMTNDSKGDFFFFEKEDPEQILAEVIELATKRLPAKGFDPLKDIQVLTPMKKAVIGTERLNLEMQNRLSNKGISYGAFGKKFFIGDRVMQTKNNYDLHLFNGEVGFVQDIQVDQRQLIVDFEYKVVQYPFSHLGDLMLSYAVSIHKFQGSECPVVIVPLHTSHFKLLTRNLLYTAITRARKLFILVGSKKAVGIAIGNKEVLKRHTGLTKKLVRLEMSSSAK